MFCSGAGFLALVRPTRRAFPSSQTVVFCGFRHDYSRGAAEASKLQTSFPCSCLRAGTHRQTGTTKSFICLFRKLPSSPPVCVLCKKKSPGQLRPGDAVFHPRLIILTFIHEGQDKLITSWAGLLASGSSYSPLLPIFMRQWSFAAFVPGYSGGSVTVLHRSSLLSPFGAPIILW
jgi:hypothetical protein